MRILYLNLDRGIPIQGDKGASVHVRAFVTAATSLGHEVALVCPTLGDGNPPPPATILHLPDRGDETDIALACRGAGLAPDAPDDKTTRRELARLAYDHTIGDRVLASLAAARFRPDLVYERHALFHRAGADIAERLDVPRLLEVNAPLIEEQRRFRGLRLEAAARAAETDSYRRADAVIAVSRSVAQHVADVLGSADRVHVVPNGVDLPRFANVTAKGREIRRQFGLGRERVVGFIGSFKPWHGVAFLLDAFAGLVSRFPDLHLLAVGDGPERGAVEVRVAALGLAGRVILPGRIPHGDMPAWLGAMDLTVAPYLPLPDFYFSPLKIVESLAAGRPVVAPDLGEIGELVADRATGLLYRPGDVVSCQDALATMLDDPALRTTLRNTARSAVAGRDWRDVVRHSLQLLPTRALCSSAA